MPIHALGCHCKLVQAPPWTVNVMKVPARTFHQSNVDRNGRTINFHTEDFTTRTITGGTPRHTGTQVPVAREFGDALGNNRVLARGDQYNSSSPNVNDHSSVMHHGHHLGTRHFRSILGEMNRMIPQAVFTVSLR